MQRRLSGSRGALPRRLVPRPPITWISTSLGGKTTLLRAGRRGAYATGVVLDLFIFISAHNVLEGVELFQLQAKEATAAENERMREFLVCQRLELEESRREL